MSRRERRFPTTLQLNTNCFPRAFDTFDPLFSNIRIRPSIALFLMQIFHNGNLEKIISKFPCKIILSFHKTRKIIRNIGFVKIIYGIS